MAGAGKMTIAITPEMERIVRDAVEAGDYASTSEVIGEALRQWTDRRDPPGYTIEELRDLVREGDKSGPSARESMADVKVEARRRFEAAGARG